MESRFQQNAAGTHLAAMCATRMASLEVGAGGCAATLDDAPALYQEEVRREDRSAHAGRAKPKRRGI